MSIDITVHGKDDLFKSLLRGPVVARQLLIDAVEDIGDRIEEAARLEAPVGEGTFDYKTKVQTSRGGKLKRHPTDRIDAVGAFAGIEGEAAGFGSVRGGNPRNRGQFSRGKASPGDIVATTEISIPEEPFYAKYVHGGTGIFGPFHSPIVPVRAKFMKFFYQGKRWRARSVAGQEANPYLERAFNEVNRSYVPIRMAELKRQINALL